MRVLFVSKPITPPFHDGTKCLVRDIALHLEHITPIVMSTPGAPPVGPRVIVESAYADPGAFTPTLAANSRAALWVLARSRADVWHFVFAPNLVTSIVGRALRGARRVPVVQTIASAPRTYERGLFFGDIVVAESEFTKRCALDAPGAPRRIEVIPPPVPHLSVPGSERMRGARRHLGIPDDAPVFVYPGDLETSCGAEVTAAATQPITDALPNAVVVFACRHKTPEAERVAARLARGLDPSRVRFVAALRDPIALFAAASAILFPVDDLYGKVDLPISLLEAMAVGTPVVCFDHGPLAELEGALVVPTGDAGAFTRSALEVAAPGPMRDRVVSRQKSAIERRFAAPVVARAYERLYFELAGVDALRPQ